ncbi:hypothetical protein [Chitinophaga solisilvae]|uniref:hypothetical protein n=1 Tax=Chitinophaga solisilvae TaxID=1233460 RepID=UPI00136FED9A|nr:hypothetical protein [Chitinophaga solisilvae]
MKKLLACMAVCMLILTAGMFSGCNKLPWPGGGGGLPHHLRQVKKVTIGEVVRSYTYDTQGRVKTIRKTDGTHSVAFSVAYGPLNRVDSLVITEPAGEPFVIRYEYDSIGYKRMVVADHEYDIEEQRPPFPFNVTPVPQRMYTITGNPYFCLYINAGQNVTRALAKIEGLSHIWDATYTYSAFNNPEYETDKALHIQEINFALNYFGFNLSIMDVNSPQLPATMQLKTLGGPATSYSLAYETDALKRVTAVYITDGGKKTLNRTYEYY